MSFDEWWFEKGSKSHFTEREDIARYAWECSQTDEAIKPLMEKWYKFAADESRVESASSNVASPKLPSLDDVLHHCLGGIVIDKEAEVRLLDKAYRFISRQLSGE